MEAYAVDDTHIALTRNQWTVRLSRRVTTRSDYGLTSLLLALLDWKSNQEMFASQPIESVLVGCSAARRKSGGALANEIVQNLSVPPKPRGRRCLRLSRRWVPLLLRRTYRYPEIPTRGRLENSQDSPGPGVRTCCASRSRDALS